MAELSSETLTFIMQRAKDLHHGSITIHINSDNSSKVDVEIIEKTRFRTDDQVLRPQNPPRALPGGRDPEKLPRRG
jgi:hypothetical protein